MENNNSKEKTIIKMGSFEIEEIDTSKDDDLYSEQLDDLIKESSEIDDLSQDLNSLLDSQQESLNNTENGINNAENIIDSSNNHLSEASQYQKTVFWQKSSLLTIGTGAVVGASALLAGPKIAIGCGFGAFGFGIYNLFF